MKKVSKKLGKKDMAKTFEELMTEAKANNTDVADVNEILYGYYIARENWGKYDDSSYVRRQYDTKAAKLTDVQIEQQADRAKRMAEKSLQWAKANGYTAAVRKVYWTARKGSLEKAVGDSGKVDAGNPTDVLIEFMDDKFLGLSAKSTLKNADIGFKNPGMGTVERNLNIELADLKKASEQEFTDLHGLSKSASARKKEIRANPSLKAQASKKGSEVMKFMRDRLLRKLNTMSDESALEYLLKDWMDASGAVYPPYIKVTGKKDSVSVEDPFKNNKLTNLHKGGITFQAVGNESIGVSANKKKIMKMRFKYESQPLASSMKMSGESW